MMESILLAAANISLRPIDDNIDGIMRDGGCTESQLMHHRRMRSVQFDHYHAVPLMTRKNGPAAAVLHRYPLRIVNGLHRGPRVMILRAIVLSIMSRDNYDLISLSSISTPKHRHNQSSSKSTKSSSAEPQCMVMAWCTDLCVGFVNCVGGDVTPYSLTGFAKRS